MSEAQDQQSLQRASLHHEMMRLTSKKMSAADAERFDQLDAEIGKIDNNTVLARARVDTLSDQLGVPRVPYSDAEARGSFSKYVRRGIADNSIKASQTTAGSGGGYLIPALFQRQLTSILKAYDRVFDPDIVSYVETETGTTYTWPVLDDVGNSASVVAEDIISTRTLDLVFNQIALPQTPTYRTDVITCPWPLLRDSGVPVDEMLVRAFAVRMARGIGSAIVSNLVSSAMVGVTTASGQTSTIIGDNLFDLQGSVDPSYQTGASKCYWAMSFSTLVSIWKLKDSALRPIFHPKYDANGNPLLLGKPVAICPSFSSPGAGNYPVGYGDFGRLLVRVVKDSATIIRFEEAPGLVEKNCVGFVGMLRCSSALLIDSNQSPVDSPIKLIRNAM